MTDSIVSAQGFVGHNIEEDVVSRANESADRKGTVQETDEELFLAAVQAISTGQSHLANGVRARWISSQQAYNNKHFDGSKYNSKRFRGRTHLFRPKTRSAVRATMQTAANALFANPDVVSISAGDDQDPQQRASAAIKQELMNYRMDSGSGRNSLQWFITAMGASQSAIINGLCVSKQYWEYREREIEVEEEQIVETEAAPGFTVMETKMVKRKRKLIERDRPMIELYPIEQVGRDPAADWTDQASGSFIYLSKPITVDDLKTIMKQPGPVKWRDLGDEELRKSIIDYEASAVRRSREEGQDRLDRARPTKGHDLTWIHEMFIRIDGEELHFWMLGKSQILSDPMPLEEAYPFLEGERPIVVGHGALDAFTVNPMSPVESWQPMQQEINDVVNLRLDNLKQNISPLTKVRRGRRVSVAAIQNRSPDTILYLDDLDDVDFDRPPPFDTAAYAEMDRLNADFDDLAGKFNGASVSTNRQLNETVGGMNLLNQSAMSMSEFDLTVWLETWVEPVLRQVLKLEEYYESDENVLALAGKKAKLLQKFGVNEITDDLLNREVTCRVNVGKGASDPIASMQRFSVALESFLKATGERGLAKLKIDEIADEIFGKSGHKDAERFIHRDDAEEDPRLKAMQQELDQLKKVLEQKQIEAKSRTDVAQINAQARITEQNVENQGEMQVEQLRAQQDAQRMKHETNQEVLKGMFVASQARQGAGKSEAGSSEAGRQAAPQQRPPQITMVQPQAPMPAPPHQENAQMAQAIEALAQQTADVSQRTQQIMQVLAATLQRMDQTMNTSAASNVIGATIERDSP